MPKHGKKYVEAAKKVTEDLYTPMAAIKLAQEISFENHD